MSKFCVGERVKCINNLFKFPCKDKVGTVIAIDCIDYRNNDVTYIAVEFDSYIRGHSCSGKGQTGHCLYLPEDSLITIDDVESNMSLHNYNVETKTIDNNNESATEDNHIKARFTDKEILDSLYTRSCYECTAGCLLKEHDDCMPYLPTSVIELLQSQQRRIDTIEKENEKLRLTIKDVSAKLKELIKEIKVATVVAITEQQEEGER